MPGVPSSYRALRFEVTAEIGDTTFDKEVVQFSSTFEMNNIPSASLVIAVGRNAEDQAVSKIHTAMDNLQYNTPAKVYLYVHDHGSQHVADKDLKATERITIFDGFATGVGWQRSTGGAACTINLQHWLADLDYTSAISGFSHPGNPSDWTYSATHTTIAIGDAGPAGGLPQWCPVPGGFQEITQGNLQSDFWAVLKKWLLGVAGKADTDPIDPRVIGGALAENSNAGVAAAALERMVSPGLGMDLAGLGDGSAIARSIQHWLGREQGAQWANTTIWGKLVGEWGPSFWFSIIPRVDDALVIPFCGGLRGDVHRTIETSEYNSCELSAYMPRGLRAVGIHHPVAMMCGGNLNVANAQATFSKLAALWNPTPITPGVVMVKDAPRWLCDPGLAHEYSYLTTGNANTVLQGTAFNRGGVDAAGNTPAGRDPAKTAGDMTSMLQKLAHHWFTCEMLKGRTGELSGRLRFDIAPGSQVKVMLGKDVHTGSDQLARPLFGTVMRTTCLINAEMQRAGTAFALAHLRTESENKDNRYSTDKPPLYTKEWRGATLQDT